MIDKSRIPSIGKQPTRRLGCTVKLKLEEQRLQNTTYNQHREVFTQQSIADHVSGHRTNVLRDNPEPPKVGCRQTSLESLFAYLQLAKPSPSADASGYRGHHSVIAHQPPSYPFPRSTNEGVRHPHDCLRDINKGPDVLRSTSSETPGSLDSPERDRTVLTCDRCATDL